MGRMEEPLALLLHALTELLLRSLYHLALTYQKCKALSPGYQP